MKQMIAIMYVMALLITPSAFASGDHEQMKGHGHGKHGSMGKMSDGEKKDVFLVKQEIDGYTVSFHAMKAAKGMEHGGSHNLMVKVEINGKAQTDIIVNSKVIHPGGKEETKRLVKMGDWYMAGYDLGHQGKHQLTVLFKTADGNKHFSGVYYP